MSRIIDEATLIVAPKPVRKSLQATARWVTVHREMFGVKPTERQAIIRLLYTLVLYRATGDDIQWMVDAGYLTPAAVELWKELQS